MGQRFQICLEDDKTRGGECVPHLTNTFPALKIGIGKSEVLGELCAVAGGGGEGGGGGAASVSTLRGVTRRDAIYDYASVQMTGGQNLPHLHTEKTRVTGQKKRYTLLWTRVKKKRGGTHYYGVHSSNRIHFKIIKKCISKDDISKNGFKIGEYIYAPPGRGAGPTLFSFFASTPTSKLFSPKIRSGLHDRSGVIYPTGWVEIGRLVYGG